MRGVLQTSRSANETAARNAGMAPSLAQQSGLDRHSLDHLVRTQ